MIFGLFVSKEKRQSKELYKLINNSSYKDFILFLNDNKSWLDNEEKVELYISKLEDIKIKFISLYETEIKNLEILEKHDNIHRTILLLNDIKSNVGLTQFEFAFKEAHKDLTDTDIDNYSKSYYKFEFQDMISKITNNLSKQLSMGVENYYSQIELDASLINQLSLNTFSNNTSIKEVLIDIFLNQFIIDPSKKKFEELEKIIKLKLLTNKSLLIDTYLTILKGNDNIYIDVFIGMFVTTVQLNKNESYEYIYTVTNNEYYKIIAPTIPKLKLMGIENNNLYILYYMSNPLFKEDINIYNDLINDIIQEYWNNYTILELIIKLKNIKQIISAHDFRDIMSNISNLQHKEMIENQMYNQNQKLTDMEDSQNNRLTNIQNIQQKELSEIRDVAESAENAAEMAERRANSAISAANSVHSKINKYI